MALLLSAAYALRAAESSVNSFHSVYFWNQLWLVAVTMSTVGYGDYVPQDDLARGFVSVCTRDRHRTRQ